MPSRSTSRAAAAAVVALAATLATTRAVAERLTFPSDTVAEAVAPPPAVPALPAVPQGMVNAAPLAGGGDVGMTYGVPTSSYGAASTFNPTLGAHLRARFNTRSYGQQQETLDLGTMKLWDLNEGVAFLDGQVTMNDDARVGYNLGVGYRWMTLPLLPWSPDDEKIMGLSLWSDGQTAGGENFFPQVGVGFELLGERIDFRANGYFPVGPESRTRDFTPTGDITFAGNSIAEQLQGVRDTALTVGEAELAGRLGDLDAWLFGGVYGFSGGEFDATGGKVGLRGYATPDLLLSIAIANDDEFDTNAIFSATWFIGRTRAENCPTGQLRDRFREPVIRNDYIATQQSVAFSSGPALVDNNGEAIRIVHVDSTAAGGGDGTFESPVNNLDNLFANSQDDDIVLAHGGSDFNGQTAVLRDGQTFFGEGDNQTLQVNTLRFGQVDLPETAVGAAAGPRPTISAPVAGAGVVLADNNVVENFTFDGGLNAVTTDATLGSFNPTLRDIAVTGVTGDAFVITSVVRADTDDLDNDDDTDETIDVLDSVTIDDIAFNNVGGRDIAIDGMRTAAEGADVNSGEVISITDVTSTGNLGSASISIINTSGTTGDTVTITDFDYNGGAGGGLFLSNTGSVVNVTQSDFTGGTGPAVEVLGNTGTVSVGATNEITDVVGDAVVVRNNEAAVTVDADITTDAAIAGGRVFIEGNEAAVNIGGDLQANGVNAVEVLNAKADVDIGTAPGGTVQDGTLRHSGAGNAVVVRDDGTDPDTANDPIAVTVLSDVTNTSGNAFLIDGGDDTVLVTGDVTDTASGIRVSNLDANASVDFAGDVNIDTTATGLDAVVLTGNDEDSSVTFGELDIVTTTGRGLVSNGGELNVDGTDGTPGSFTSSITTGSGQAIAITGGSSTTGVSFDTVNTTSPVNAVVVTGFDGTVSIDGGTLAATGQAVSFTNSAFALDGVTINSGTGVAVQAVFNDDDDRVTSLTDINASGDNVTYALNGTGDVTATWTDITNAGLASFAATGGGRGTLTVTDAAFATGYDYDSTDSGGLAVTMNTADGDLTGGPVNFLNSGAGNSSIAITDGTFTGGFDYDVTGTGNLAATMTDVTGVGDTTLDVNGDGDGSLTMTRVNTGGQVLANSLNTSTGDLSVTATNSGDTSAFTGITVNQRGSGAALATFNTVTSTSGIDFDSASDTVSTLSVSGGDYGGAIAADETGDGDLNVTLTNVEGASNVTVNEGGTGNATLTMTGRDYSGAITFNEAGAGSATSTLTNVTAAGGGVDFDSAGGGAASLAVTGGEYGGPILADVALGSAGNFSASVTGGTTFTATPRIAFNGQNTGTVDYEVSGLTFNTGAATDAIDLVLGANVTTADVTVSSNTVQTLDGSALDLDVGSGTIDFLLSGNNFTNNSGTLDTVSVTNNGGTLNSTLTGNTLTNSGAGGELLLTNENGSRTNLAASGNGVAGADVQFVNNSAQVDFQVRGTDAAAVDSANAANVTFPTGLFTFDSNLVVPTP